MMTITERRTLPHTRLARAACIAGFAMMFLGMAMLVGMPDQVQPSVILASLGLIAAFSGGYYWGCGNNGCSYR